LSNRRKAHRLNIYYKALHKQTPEHINNLMPKPVSSHTAYNLRNKAAIRPNPSRLLSSYNSFFNQTTRDWNSLPEATKSINTLNTFKRTHSKHIIKNSYHKYCHGQAGVWLTRIRMGLCGLNGHRFSYNFIETPSCPSCNQGPETTLHYLWYCRTYQAVRTVMLDRITTEMDIGQIDESNIEQIILHGKVDKKQLYKLFTITSEYLTNTKRFT
jgi:hypothetical protein